LEYGRVEERGLRCCYHGWLFDVKGNCLEQPAEPPHNNFKDKIKQKAYPCAELGGLILTYMGPPEKMPLVPNYSFLARQDGTRSLKVRNATGKLYTKWLSGR